ncbi:phosphotransferase family protein [Edaphobacillus lindanitolerans]|uniref:Phosphotransferase enzyme family protein n=1 Tax=Edaphobacillus lindanitolerans TaxID=550447 RepID=A0A1U7PPJ5_9BACI|nr:aminoglycoside phosphotransferase family protein [Edaphobacillus lindanitolerans]SIT88516.1 Phosphotransferase enzyme family protein [Edaphobacillus lindanitolerans]
MAAARPIRNLLPGLLVLAGGIYTVYYYYMYWLRIYGALCLPGRGEPVLVEVTRGIWLRLDSLLFPTIFGVFMIGLGIMLIWKRKFSVAVLTLVLSAAVINWPGFSLIIAGSALGLIFWRKTLIPAIDLPARTFEWLGGKIGEADKRSFRELPAGGEGHRLYSFKNDAGDSFVVKASLSEETAAREADALRLASARGLPVPGLLAADRDKTETGAGTLLMQQLPGGPFLHPLDFDLWADGLAGLIGRVHAADPSGFPPANVQIAEPAVPGWAVDRAVWERAARLAAVPAAPVPHCLIHGDFEPSNVLFEEGRMSGLADWERAGTGPAQLDIGRMRIALVLIHGRKIADRFLKTYRDSAGEGFAYGPEWDIRAISGWIREAGPSGISRLWSPFGVTTLTEEEVQRRLELFVKELGGE